MFSAVAAGQGEPRYPLPWAREPGVSFLVSPAELRALFEQSGWRIVEWTDETDAFRSPPASTLPPIASEMRRLISGEDFPERARNFAESFATSAIGSVLVLAERP